MVANGCRERLCQGCFKRFKKCYLSRCPKFILSAHICPISAYLHMKMCPTLCPVPRSDPVRLGVLMRTLEPGDPSKLTSTSMARRGTETQGFWQLNAQPKHENSVSIYPLVMIHSNWKWPFIVDFPIKSGDFGMSSFPLTNSYMLAKFAEAPCSNVPICGSTIYFLWHSVSRITLSAVVFAMAKGTSRNELTKICWQWYNMVPCGNLTVRYWKWP